MSGVRARGGQTRSPAMKRTPKVSLESAAQRITRRTRELGVNAPAS